MALAVVSSTTRVTANAVSAASATFSPPAQSILVCISHANSNISGSVTMAVSNSVSALTWTQAAFSNFTNGQPGGVFIHVAPCPSAITNTVLTATSTNNNSTAGDRLVSVRVWWLSGGNLVTPTGGTNKNSDSTNNLTTAPFTNVADGSIGFAGATDWSGAGTVASSDVTGDGFFTSGVLDGWGGSKVLGSAGASSTFNFDGPGTGLLSWNWASVEILAAAPTYTNAAPVNRARLTRSSCF